MNYGLHSVELLSESQAGKDITTRELLVTNRKVLKMQFPKETKCLFSL